ncbi:MAG: hypothetical protein ACR2KX_09985 [Chitinophagaceae bacterium]
MHKAYPILPEGKGMKGDYEGLLDDRYFEDDVEEILFGFVSCTVPL